MRGALRPSEESSRFKWLYVTKKWGCRSSPTKNLLDAVESIRVDGCSPPEDPLDPALRRTQPAGSLRGYGIRSR